MKYVLIVIMSLLVASMVVSAYSIGERLSKASEIINKSQGVQQNTADPTLKSDVTKLQNELAELKDVLFKQTDFVLRLKEDNLAQSVRIAKLEKQLQDTIAIIQAVLLDKGIKPEQGDKPLHLLDPLLNQILSGEIFKDQQFAKVFQEKIEEVVKNIQEKQRKEQMERFTKQLLDRMTSRIADFGKTLNLNDYQQQEFSRILSESGTKAIELFSQFREQNISGEEFNNKRQTLMTEANEKVKAILLPNQYEEYEKTVGRILGGFGGGPGGMMQVAPPGTPGGERVPRRRQE
ncbi:MAG: hypothetical protein QME51_08525 [Planctomycetota bacterium]|nr:hypothetical protein [Planctomycetota bacterium]MDI6788400.1 hypothetical protein [Planctomycetota bacterium]